MLDISSRVLFYIVAERITTPKATQLLGRRPIDFRACGQALSLCKARKAGKAGSVGAPAKPKGYKKLVGRTYELGLVRYVKWLASVGFFGRGMLDTSSTSQRAKT